jgi:hypothetical protein
MNIARCCRVVFAHSPCHYLPLYSMQYPARKQTDLQRQENGMYWEAA